MNYLGLPISQGSLEHLREGLLFPGDKVYFAFEALGHYSFVAEVAVTKVELILSDGVPNSGTLWAYLDEDLIPRQWSENEDEQEDEVDLHGCEVVNLYFMIGEPIGHSLQLGAADGVYRSLDRALSSVVPFPECTDDQFSEALRSFRRSRCQWMIRKEDECLVERLLSKYPSRRVWVRG